MSKTNHLLRASIRAPTAPKPLESSVRLSSKRGWGPAEKPIKVNRVQRLFATFPDGQPGAALLLLRLSVAAMLAFHGSAYWFAQPPMWSSLGCGGVAILLGLGLFTPFVAIGGAIVGTIALGLCMSCDPAAGAFVLIVMAALGMLGAGAYSLDARIYGRREVVVPARNDR
jgi:hypothetical protein